MTAGLPGPVPSTPPPNDLLRLVARQLFEQIDAEHRRGLGFTALRQVEVAAVDQATVSATVILGGDVDNPIPMVRPLAGYAPIVGDIAWAFQNGSDLMLIGGPGLGGPKARLVTTRVQPVNTTPQPFSFTSGTGGSVSYDAGGMADQANSQLVVGWPGTYRFGFGGHIEAAGAGRRIMEAFKKGTDRLLRWESDQTSQMDRHVSDTQVFAVGDTVQLWVTSTGGAMDFGSASQGLGMRLWMSYNP